MKFVLLAALVSIVSAADPKAVGEWCTGPKDVSCGTGMCCGIATKGKMCATKDCKEVSSTNETPNVLMCNKSTPVDHIVEQKDTSASPVPIYFKYMATDFTCFPPQKAEETIIMQ